MYEPSHTPMHEEMGAEIARDEVSEDGVTWRPYDAVRDNGRAPLHRRIEFAQPAQQD